MGPKLCKTLEICLECMGVCVYVCNSPFKGKNVLSIFIPFFSLFGVWVKFWEKCHILFQIHCVSFTLVILQ